MSDTASSGTFRSKLPGCFAFHNSKVRGPNVSVWELLQFSLLRSGVGPQWPTLDCWSALSPPPDAAWLRPPEDASLYSLWERGGRADTLEPLRMRLLSEDSQRERKASLGQVLGPCEAWGMWSCGSSVLGTVSDARGAEVDRPGPWLQGVQYGGGHGPVERLSQPQA